MDLSPITPVGVVTRPVAPSFDGRMGLVLRVAVPDSRMLALACTPMMITHPLTKGDLNRGRAPDLKKPALAMLHR